MSYRLDRVLRFDGDRIVWAQRREPPPGDDVTPGDGAQLWQHNDSRFIVRAVSGLEYRIGQRFYDEDNFLRIIRGLRKMGRTHYELLARLPE